MVRISNKIFFWEFLYFFLFLSCMETSQETYRTHSVHPFERINIYRPLSSIKKWVLEVKKKFTCYRYHHNPQYLFLSSKLTRVTTLKSGGKNLETIRISLFLPYMLELTTVSLFTCVTTFTNSNTFSRIGMFQFMNNLNFIRVCDLLHHAVCRGVRCRKITPPPIFFNFWPPPLS